MLSTIILAALSVRATYASPYPQSDDGSNPYEILPVQPPTGGGKADDCGAGPVSFNTDTWNSQGMDDVVTNYYNANNGDTFDFHQSFSESYGVGLYCGDAADVCNNEPSACNQLQGSTQAKEQGYLGIRAIENAQNVFVAMDAAVGRAGNNLLGSLDDFTTQFLKKEDNNGIFKSLFEGVVGLLSTGLGLLGPEGEIAGSFLELGAGVAGEFAFPDEDPLKDFANALTMWGGAQNGLHSALNNTHSALFSNGALQGQSAQGASAALPGWMKNGQLINPPDYTQFYVNLDSTFTKVLAIKLLESVAKGQNGFIVFIPNVTGDCAKWHGKGVSTDLKYCAPEGMYYLMGLDKSNNPITQQGFDKVSQWGGFNFDLVGLIHSTAWSYNWYGLDYQSTADDWKNMLTRDQNGMDIASQLGAFQMPVCQLEAWNWRQSDDMSADNPPCDCKNVADKNGKKFIDSPNVSDAVKSWLNSKC